mmetsp:Transcript_9833/g.14771  ORF Transcript_9833/g.14771 Transcript_9833/m.14771 type:complete len:267 (-) Transcript_9833:94-894(-)|eukprot:CAMPEP_0194094052 /NCGR_PEP_ID=MMETSP0149-20130528/52494_1 /TAXON_ID=122233 /ORGANISM="Chaetoceros debilis, Strain MM31A-1" /LENGTH=266 /DNA_ID=CAMNT_0038779567 /DNA_START=108 /DNA_END=908 /DNA_ORIENTATION=-
MIIPLLLPFLYVLVQMDQVSAFTSAHTTATTTTISSLLPGNISSRPPQPQFPYHLKFDLGLSLGLGEYSISLTKPLGIILEEREAGKPGVQVESLAKGGAADAIGVIVKGDALVSVDGVDLSEATFDTAMETIIEAPGDRPLEFILSDGLGRMDIAKNLLKTLSPEEAIFADTVVRKSVRSIRKIGAQLGDLFSVEIVIGAGVQDEGRSCQVRFFAIFSTDTVTTYSCSVAAKGVKNILGDIEIVALSCAKDEGWGQTIDLIREVE